MNPPEVKIPTFETAEFAASKGFTIEVTPDEVKALRRMNRKQKRAWAADKKRAAGFKPRSVPHVGARVAGAPDEDHKAAKNAAKRARRARR